jgi:hypothetical protein
VRSKARSPSRLADALCEAIKTLTAHRTSRAYATQWIMVHTVQRHLGIDDDKIEAAIGLAIERGRLKAVGDPAHSISLIYGWTED